MLFKEEKKSDTDILIEMLLERGDRKSVRLAKIMHKNHSKMIITTRWTRSELKEKRLAKEYLYSLFDDNMRREMIALDSIISENDSKIPWDFDYFRSFYNHKENFRNWGDPECHECDSFTIIRGENGFEPEDTNIYNSYIEYLYGREKAFIRKYKKELGEMHFALTRQENLLRNCGLKFEGDRELAKLLTYNLGLLRSWVEEKDNDNNKKLIK